MGIWTMGLWLYGPLDAWTVDIWTMGLWMYGPRDVWTMDGMQGLWAIHGCMDDGPMVLSASN